MDPRKPSTAAYQLLFVVIATLVLSLLAVTGSDPEPRETGHEGVWTLASSAALEIFMAAGGPDTMKSRIIELWDAGLGEEARRRVFIADRPRDDKLTVGEIRVVEFLGGACYLGFDTGKPLEGDRSFFGESGESVEFSDAVLEATSGYSFFVLWKQETTASP